MLDENLMGSTN